MRPHWPAAEINPVPAARPDRDVLLELGTLVFQPGAGAPHATDLERGRRPGTGRFPRTGETDTAFRRCVPLPLIEPQDAENPVFPPWMRSSPCPTSCLHFQPRYAAGSGKPNAAYARATRRSPPRAIATPSSTPTRRGRSISRWPGADRFRAAWPDVDHHTVHPDGGDARYVEAAMTLSHAEALAAITLTQPRLGAPVCYGTFPRMSTRSRGATPRHAGTFRASLVAGQLVRPIGLPRCASGSAANINDLQPRTKPSSRGAV